VILGEEDTEILFERDVEGPEHVQTDTIEVSLPGRAHHDLVEAMSFLKAQYMDVLELPDHMAPHVTITALELQDENPPLLKIGAERYLPNVDETITVACPALPPISGDVQDVVYTIMEEAVLCVEGKRQQLSLFEPETPEEIPETPIPESTERLPEPETTPSP